MKRKLFKILPIVFLGGILGISALSEVQQMSEIKAAESNTTGYVEFGSSIVTGWDTTAKNYCGAYYGSKTGLTISNKSISDFSVLSSGTHQLKVWVTGFTNGGTNSVKVSTLSNTGSVINVGTAQTGKLGSGSNLSSATKKETDAFTFTPTTSVTGLQIELGTKCVCTKVRWEISLTQGGGTGEGGGTGGQEDTPPVVTGTEYTLVSDASTLSVGDTIVLGSSANNKVAGAFNTKYLSDVTASFSSGKVTATGAAEITLGGSSGAWKLLLGSDQIIAGSSGSISLGSEGTAWTIAINEGGSASISDGNGKIQYNSGSPRFTYYTSVQGSIEIYKKAGEAVTYSVIYNGNGHTGTVVDSKSPYSAASSVTILANGFDSKTGEVFKEWNTKADGTGTSYAAGSTLTITSNLTLYAIWEEEYIPVGDSFTKVTSASALYGDLKFLFVYRNGETVKANGSLEGGDHFTAYDAKIVNDELTYANEKVTPLTLVKDGSQYYIELNGNYLTLTANSTNKLEWKEKANANKWSFEFNNGNAVVSSSIGGTTHSIFYNGSGTGRFSNYSSSTMSPIELWAKTGQAKEITLSKESLDINAGQEEKLSVVECHGFSATSYAWEITSGSEFVSITAGQGTNEITLKGLKEGEATVYVTCDGVKAKATISVHEYKYNVLDKDAYFITTDGAMMTKDKSYLADVDFDESNMWSFEKAYAGDNSYYLSSSEGYLSFAEDVLADGKNISELEITKDPVNVWTVSYSDGNGYKVVTETKTQGSRSLATHEEKWYAFTGNNYVNLIEAGTFDHIYVKALPTTKQYFVGDDLKPLNSHVYAVYTNGFESEITNKITWDKLTEGTKAYGKVTIGGQVRDVVMDGIKVYKGDASTFVIEGLSDTYSVGEKINKDYLKVSITYKLSGEADIKKELTKTDYIVEPERIEETTTKVKVALAKDPTVYFEQPIKIIENPYVAANYVGVGDEVVIGTLGYNPYEITGGVELAYEDNKFSYSSFGYLPKGKMVFEVGKEGSYYTLKDKETGYYLKGDNSAFTFNKPDTKSVYAEVDGHYEFNMPVTIAGSSYVVTMKTDPNPDFSYSNVFYSFDCINGGYNDYIAGRSDLENNKFLFDICIGGVYSENVAEVDLAYCSFENGVFQYALELSSSLPDECLFTFNYDDTLEEWSISSKPHQDKQLYFNKDGKFGFYAKGSNYTPVMLFRNNIKPLQSEIKSLSVSLQEGMDEVTVGEPFPWTSALIVKAYYEGGASKIIPVGGYTVTKMPDTSVIGTAKGEISYGQIGHEITKEFSIKVKGKTQAFDVVCKDPILVGETYQAHLANDYEVPEGEPLTWSVSDSTLASIDQEGNVTGLAPGYVDVIATSYDGTYSDFEHIRIYQQVESVTLDKHEAEINAGETVQLTATVLPENASNTKVTYSSSDPNIAFVDENTGLVTGVKPGTATITCAAQNHPEENFDTCVITVKEAPVVHVTGITLDCNYKEIEVKDTFKLNAIITPEDAAVKNVTWSSSNEKIATVDQNGNVKGVAKGECVITATTADGGFTASCTIKVKASATNVPVTSVSVSQTSANLNVGEKVTVVATVAPGNADNKNVMWSTSDETVATVNNGVISAIGEGQAVISVTTVDGGFTAEVRVTVTAKLVTEIKLNQDDFSMIVGDSKQLTYSISPAEFANSGVRFSSSSEDVVVVDSQGNVYAIGEGEATVTITSLESGKTDSVKITVSKASQEEPAKKESFFVRLFKKIINFFKNLFKRK